jgi:hypothetical protein
MSEVPELPLLDRGATLGASSISDWIYLNKSSSSGHARW